MADAQIYFAAPVNETTVPQLIAAVTERVGKGAKSILLAISSTGGNIYWGTTAYNFLRGLGVEIITHNAGQVDSIAGVIYCAGERRYSVPEGRFLIHGVTWTFAGTNPAVAEKTIQDTAAQLAILRDTIATILADRTGRALQDVATDMLTETNLSALVARDYGFVHEIKSDIFDPTQEIVQIVA